MRARERDLLLEAVASCEWNLSRAADRLGVSRMTLYRRLARCGLSRPGSSAPADAPTRRD